MRLLLLVGMLLLIGCDLTDSKDIVGTWTDNTSNTSYHYTWKLKDSNRLEITTYWVNSGLTYPSGPDMYWDIDDNKLVIADTESDLGNNPYATYSYDLSDESLILYEGGNEYRVFKRQ